MKKSISTSVGRPLRENWELIRSVAWATAVYNICGRINSSSLARELDLPATWRLSRYMNGDRPPDASLLERVEGVYPGTRKYFDSPLWKLTQFRDCGLHPIKELFFSLPPECRGNLILHDLQNQPLFWRKFSKIEDELDEIRKVTFRASDSLDALLSIAVLIHESVVIQDKNRLASCVEEWASLVGRLEICGAEFLGEKILQHLDRFGLNLFSESFDIFQDNYMYWSATTRYAYRLRL